jgi:type IV pilus assembly protein PilQ
MNNQNWNLAMRTCQKIAVFFSICFAVFAAQAQTAIEAVSGSVQSGVEVVKIDLSQPLTAVPTGFSIQSPARIALDFPGVANGMGRSTVDINQGNLRSVSVVQAGDRTRVVLNLKQATPYKAQIKVSR